MYYRFNSNLYAKIGGERHSQRELQPNPVGGVERRHLTGFVEEREVVVKFIDSKGSFVRTDEVIEQRVIVSPQFRERVRPHKAEYLHVLALVGHIAAAVIQCPRL